MRSIGALLSVIFSIAPLSAQDGSTRDNWPEYGGQHSAWRYSALEQISTRNVSRLVPVWTFQTGDYEGGLQSTPIVIDGVMYVSTSRNRVFALEAATGREIWQYKYVLQDSGGLIYGPWNRGIAVGHGMVYMGTLDNAVVALDQKTGREVWKVVVEDMKQCGCNITAAPLLVKDKVITGVTGGDSAHRGYVTAFDAKTGRQAWRFWTIPAPGEPGNETWAGESWKFGGGSSWMTGSYDPELNLVYWSIGNPAADFYGGSRKGNNLYTDSVVALDADSGKLKWYHQQIPHDVWDFDTAYENVLVDLPVKGRMRKLLINVNKGGVLFIVDRTNGEFIHAYPIVRHINWITGITETGQLVGRNEPVVGKTMTICPAIGGGRSWNHGAFSPKTKWYYTTAIEWCQDVTAQTEEPREGQTFFGGVFTMKNPPGDKSSGHLDAYDPVTGKNFWTYESKYPLLASLLATAGDLIFTGDPEGHFFALDARSGKKLWSHQTGSGNRGSPVTYSVKGRQYVATPSGWGSALAGLMAQIWPEAEGFRTGSSVTAFALPEGTR
ncbi:MAG: PQQ-dependent dehydrogenase, methanol/ethanol family [Bryobacteraceae bacterium]|nr:PQQ-dependent dehydrogenase, methanol/ethanol family [Bryobacteraceae bacterium]